MNNTIEKFNHNFQVPQLYSNIVKQDIKDPVTTFLDLLYKGKNLKVDIPSRDDINLEEKNSVNKTGFVEINFENKQQFLEIKPKKVAQLGYTRSPAYPTNTTAFKTAVWNIIAPEGSPLLPGAGRSPERSHAPAG